MASFTIALVGNPNVGKSALFNALTGMYVTVSNYPGTTVEVSRGKMRLADADVAVVDTPGMYSLSPITEEEAVARRLLTEERVDLVLDVVDVKNLERSLSMTLELVEAGLPVILVVNMIDEAPRYGVTLDPERLSAELGIPVVTTSAVNGKGIDDLKGVIQHVKSGIR